MTLFINIYEKIHMLILEKRRMLVKLKRFFAFTGFVTIFLIVFCGQSFARKSSSEIVSSLGYQEDQTKSFPAIIGEGDTYTLGKDDVIEIVVRNQEEFSGVFVIGPDGNIQYKFVGDVKAEGLNKEQVKEILTEKLKKYVKSPEVSVVILAYRSKFVYILGEVGRPGKYPMKGDVISLRDAIVSAGLPTRSAALRRIYVVKSDRYHPTRKKIDLFKILYKGITKDNVDLVPGDIVVVPSTIPSEINRALANLLSPFNQARGVDEVITHDWGNSGD